jgi:hypothetical protein
MPAPVKARGGHFNITPISLKAMPMPRVPMTRARDVHLHA